MKIEYIIVGLLVIMLLGAIVSPDSVYKNQAGKDTCEKYLTASIDNLPVGCYEYFGIK